MRIRPATAADVATITAIVLECDPVSSSEDYELAKARDAVSLPTRRTLIAELGGEAVGYVSLDLGDPEIAHLSRLFVRPAHWGTGVAASLHDHALKLADGYMQIRLFTPTASGRARRFYEREGWRAVGTSRHAALGLELTEYRRAPRQRRK